MERVFKIIFCEALIKVQDADRRYRLLFSFLFVITACPAEKRSFYQFNLLQYMTARRTEAGHSEPLPESDAPQDPTAEPRLNTPVKQTIYWMFDEMDVAPMDRKLSRSEVASFLNDTTVNVHPRACAESQWSYCDYNSDGYIGLSEWCWCTGLDPSKIRFWYW